MSWPVISSLLAAVLLLSPAEAHTAEPAAAELLGQALTRYTQADFQGAVGLLNEASGATADPQLLGEIYLHLGVNQEILGQLTAARDSFRRALSNSPELRPDPQRFRAPAIALFEEVLASLSGRLRVGGDRPDVRVWLDGKLLGPPPLETMLPIGRHQLQLRSGGGALILTRDLLVAPGSELAIEVPAAGAAAASPASRPTAQSALFAEARELDALLLTQPPQAPPRRRIWTWVSAGGAALSLGLAAGLGLWANADYQAWEEELGTGEDRGRWQELAEGGQAKELAANILFGVAGGLAVTAVVLYFLEGSKSEAFAHEQH